MDENLFKLPQPRTDHTTTPAAASTFHSPIPALRAIAGAKLALGAAVTGALPCGDVVPTDWRGRRGEGGE